MIDRDEMSGYTDEELINTIDNYDSSERRFIAAELLVARNSCGSEGEELLGVIRRAIANIADVAAERRQGNQWK